MWEDKKPRLGFLGVGWIGRNRMAAIARSNGVRIAAFADPLAEMMDSAFEIAPNAVTCNNLKELLQQDLDGVVIATPNALHAAQSIQALQAGCAVFCQKPIGRNADETRQVVAAAKQANRLLGVDLSYRFVKGMKKIKELIRTGSIGSVYAADLMFHNAYGPDKPWYYNFAEAGGGCVIDLGIHLVDTALWALDFPDVENVSSRLFSGGRSLAGRRDRVEDYAVIRMDLANGACVNISCSWNLPAGRDAWIHAIFYGTGGGLSLRNVNGSFYDFKAERFNGTRRDPLEEPPDDWGGRSAMHWADRLGENPEFDRGIEEIIRVAEVLDAVYERSC